MQVTSAGGRNQGGFPRFAQFQDAEVNRKTNCHNILSINIPTLTKKNAVTTSKEPGKFSKDRLKDHLAHECLSFSRNDTRDRGRDVHGDEGEDMEAGVDMETGHDLESQGRRCGVEVEPERQGRGEDCALEEENCHHTLQMPV